MDRKIGIIIIAAIAILLIAILATEKNPAPAPQPTTTPSSSVPITTTSTTITPTMSLELFTISTPAPDMTATILANPKTGVITMVTIVTNNDKISSDTVIVSYMVSGSATTEYFTSEGLITTLKITAVGISKTAVVYSGTSSSTITDWTPVIVKIFEPYRPYAIISNTTLFTAPGDVLETYTLYESSGSIWLDHSYTKIIGTNTYILTLKMNGSYASPATSVEWPVYTRIITQSYPWYNSGTVTIPIEIVSGTVNNAIGIRAQNSMKTETNFMSIIGETAPETFMGYQVQQVTTVVNSTATVMGGAVHFVGRRSDGYFIVTITQGDTTGKVVTSTMSNIDQLFTLITSVQSVGTILINNTPVVTVVYRVMDLNVTATLGMNNLVVHGIFQVYTDTNSGYIIMSLFTLANIDVARVTVTTI